MNFNRNEFQKQNGSSQSPIRLKMKFVLSSMIRNTLTLMMLSFLGCAPAVENSDSTSKSNVAPAPPGAQSQIPSTPSGTINERIEAKAGVTGKGQSYGGGVISEPVSQYWKIKEKIAFDIAIPHSLNLFKANSISGKGPQSHEEFMEKIIKPMTNFKLPELPEGHQYQYDPVSEKLFVVRPAN